MWIAVMVLYDIDKAAESVQHLVKWIMDCYSDSCKLIMCCEDDADILEPVRSRCKIVKLDAPVTHEVSILTMRALMNKFWIVSSNYSLVIDRSRVAVSHHNLLKFTEIVIFPLLDYGSTYPNRKKRRIRNEYELCC